jgi:hypothetical protein
MPRLCRRSRLLSQQPSPLQFANPLNAIVAAVHSVVACGTRFATARDICHGGEVPVPLGDCQETASRRIEAASEAIASARLLQLRKVAINHVEIQGRLGALDLRGAFDLRKVLIRVLFVAFGGSIRGGGRQMSVSQHDTKLRPIADLPKTPVKTSVLDG